ncbi:MAG: hypothetical protein ACFFAZ_06535 [Promethearchaeota archaeon]
MRREIILIILLSLPILSPPAPGTGTRQKAFSLNANSGLVLSQEVLEGIRVECSFSSHPDPIDFAVIRSDMWDLIGTPNRTLCIYFVTAIGGSFSFDVFSNSTWYTYFWNDNDIAQDITWHWKTVLQGQAPPGIFTPLAIVSLIAVVIGAFMLLRYIGLRSPVLDQQHP